MTTTQIKSIDTTLAGYQPLAAYSMKYESGASGTITQDDRTANIAAKKMITDMLLDAGFRWSESHHAWYSRTQCAVIETDSPRDIKTTTIGVTVMDGGPRGVHYVNHQMDGTYDALPLTEKFRMSGSPGSLENWLADFDRCGKSRPGDGRK